MAIASLIEPSEHRKPEKAEGEGKSTVPADDSGAEMTAMMHAYLEGDARAFAKLFDALGPRIYRYLIRLCGNTTMAEDMVQTTFLNVHRARESFRRGDRVVPWVYAIAQNVFRDELRRRKRRLADLTADGEMPRHLEASSPFGTPHLANVVQRALDSLSEEQREVVVLHKIEGLSMSELSSVLGISSGAARVRAHRGYKAIAEFIAEHGE